MTSLEMIESLKREGTNPEEIATLWNRRVLEKTGRNADEFLLLCRVFGCDFEELARFLSKPDMFRKTFLQKDVSEKDCETLFAEAPTFSPQIYESTLAKPVWDEPDDPYETIRMAELALLQDRFFHFNSALQTGLPGRRRCWAVDSFTVRKLFQLGFFEPVRGTGKFCLSKKGRKHADGCLRFVREQGPGFIQEFAILDEDEILGRNAA